jgi:septal ring factor EnvC (AmiA/AmiB activator)
LEGKQAEQQKVVSTLQKEQKTIESLITEQRKKDAALNAQIEKLIAEEVARAKARAEAEARAAAERKAREAREAAAKKRAEELARKKAAAEAAARENARRIAEAKAREERAKQQALAAAKKSAEEKRAAEQAAREAEEARRNAERRAAEEARAHEREMAEARKKEQQERQSLSLKKNTKSSFIVSSEDKRLSGNFESNRGRLPMPITGGYRIVSGFGSQAVEGLSTVRLDNKGIKIKGQAGAHARSIFDGVVCAVFNISGTIGVMVRHGSYISVYSNLSSVSVRNGQNVTTRQSLGVVGSEGILQFQLRKGTAVQNPSRWLAR